MCMMVNYFWPYFFPRSCRSTLEKGPILVITSIERERQQKMFLLVRDHGFECTYLWLEDRTTSSYHFYIAHLFFSC